MKLEGTVKVTMKRSVTGQTEEVEINDPYPRETRIVIKKNR